MMPLNSLSLKNTGKSLLIEGLSMAAAFLTDALIKANEPDMKAEEAVRFAMDLRVYYLTKNILYSLDTLLITKDNNFRHLYSGLFNLGVASTVYPANQLLADFSVRHTHMMGAQSIIYATGVTSRLLIEKKMAQQSIKQHVSHNIGKLVGGALGIFFSTVPSSGMASPALYWSGELVDVYRIRVDNEGLITILLSLKSTVPIQAFLSQMVKMSFRATGKQLAIPEFSLDGVVALSHILMIKSLSLVIPKEPEPSDVDEQTTAPSVQTITPNDIELGVIAACRTP